MMLSRTNARADVKGYPPYSLNAGSRNQRGPSALRRECHVEGVNWLSLTVCDSANADKERQV